MPWWATVALTVIIKRLAITLLLKIVKQIPNKWKRTFISSTKCVTPYVLLLFFRFFLLLPCSYKCPPSLSVNSNSPSPYQTSNSYWWPKFNNKYFTYDFSLGFTELYLYVLATSRLICIFYNIVISWFVLLLPIRVRLNLLKSYINLFWFLLFYSGFFKMTYINFSQNKIFLWWCFSPESACESWVTQKRNRFEFYDL